MLFTLISDPHYNKILEFVGTKIWIFGSENWKFQGYVSGSECWNLFGGPKNVIFGGYELITFHTRIGYEMGGNSGSKSWKKAPNFKKQNWIHIFSDANLKISGGRPKSFVLSLFIRKQVNQALKFGLIVPTFCLISDPNKVS